MGYVDVLKKCEMKNVKLAVSRPQAWKDQAGTCAKCKNKLSSCYCKYVEDKSARSGFKILCSDCYFKGKRK